MPSDRQIQASRLNGAKSRGPVTAAGKSHSSRNAYKHGLLASTFVLEVESKDRFRELSDSLFDEFQPEGPFEESLVEIMIAARWRQLRLNGMETSGLQYQMRRQAEQTPAILNEDASTRTSIGFRSLADDSRSLDLISRYDARFERQYLRAHRRLTEVQDRRRPAPPVTPAHAEGTRQVDANNQTAPETTPHVILKPLVEVRRSLPRVEFPFSREARRKGPVAEIGRGDDPPTVGDVS